jgi:hypothetical protein
VPSADGVMLAFPRRSSGSTLHAVGRSSVCTRCYVGVCRSESHFILRRAKCINSSFPFVVVWLTLSFSFCFFGLSS